MTQPSNPVLVTGATGFLAMHCILNLLEKGWHVRGTLRNAQRGAALRKTLAQHTGKIENLELFSADLMQDAGWDEALAGCQYVLHVASPFPAREPEHEDDLILPAREGTKRVLRAAARQGIQRLVLTSSIAAVSAGYTDKARTFSEKDWSNLDGEIAPYPKSKTLAEKAAWEFVGNLPEGQKLELAVVNPGYILGPVLDAEPRTSNEMHIKLMRRQVPGVGRLKMDMVDVRDVAEAQYLALVTPEAAGRRFICVSESMWLAEIAQVLDEHFAPKGYKIPRRMMPDFLVRLVGLFDKTVRNTVRGLGVDYAYDASQTRRVLGWQPRPAKTSLVEMGESLIQVGIV